MKVRLSGDAMLIAEFDHTIDPVVNERVVELSTRLRALRIPGVRDVVPGYCTLGVHFDPLRTDLALLEQLVVKGGSAPVAIGSVASPHVHEIPVLYGGADGPDLAAVAAFAGCDPVEVVARHAAVVYRVYMLGFVPGFAYLGRVDSRIAAPRRGVPRERVPVGSVGIAGEQTGVYPMPTPGGWQLIGRTTTRMFDPDRLPPALLAPGDRIRFVPQ